jgi:hypothetical protein
MFRQSRVRVAALATLALTLGVVGVMPASAGARASVYAEKVKVCEALEQRIIEAEEKAEQTSTVAAEASIKLQEAEQNGGSEKEIAKLRKALTKDEALAARVANRVTRLENKREQSECRRRRR